MPLPLPLPALRLPVKPMPPPAPPALPSCAATPTLALLLRLLLVWVLVLTAANKATWLSASRFTALPLTLLPWMVRLLFCPSPVALMVVVPLAVTVLPRAVSLVFVLLLWLLLLP